MADTIRLVGDTQRAYAKRRVDEAPTGYVVKIAAETRRDRQNAKMHAMIADLRKQVPEHAVYSAEDTKLRFLDALGAELCFLPKLEGQGMFPVGLKSSTLTVEQFAMLITIIYAEGDKHGVVWSEPAQAAA